MCYVHLLPFFALEGSCNRMRGVNFFCVHSSFYLFHEEIDEVLYWENLTEDVRSSFGPTSHKGDVESVSCCRILYSFQRKSSGESWWPPDEGEFHWIPQRVLNVCLKSTYNWWESIWKWFIAIIMWLCTRSNEKKKRSVPLELKPHCDLLVILRLIPIQQAAILGELFPKVKFPESQATDLLEAVDSFPSSVRNLLSSSSFIPKPPEPRATEFARWRKMAGDGGEEFQSLDLYMD